MAENGTVMSIAVEARSGLKTGPPKPLFQSDIRNGSFCMGQYGVSASGEKFLVIETPRAPGGNTQMHVVSNWDAPRGQ